MPTWLTQAVPWLALLAVWPLLYALLLLLATLNYMRLRLRPGVLERIPRETLPPEQCAVLDAMQPELQALGFARQASLRLDPLMAMQPPPLLAADLYRHHTGQAWALAQPAGAGHGRTLGTVEWLTCFADGQNWAGLNGQAHTTLAAPPGWTYVDDAQPSTAASWQAYAQRLAAAPAPVVNDLEEVLRRAVALRHDTVHALAAQGRALPAGAGQYRLAWREALRMAWSELRGQGRLARQAVAAPPGDGTGLAQARQTAEALGFELQQAVKAALAATHDRRRTFWATAVLFLAVGAALFSWRTAWMLLLVIAVHEGGHWLAMRWAGYQRQSVFFLPGLGGMATGEKADATPWQKVLVYLAGPMPGLLLAGAALAWFTRGAGTPPPAWAVELLTLCVLINAFNLLPLIPLDGGRVVETLLFARLPVLRLVFALAGTGALLALAWALRDPIIMAVAGVLLLGLPWQWRVMRLERAVRQAHPGARPADAATATRRLFAVLQQPRFARWRPAQRTAAVQSLLPALQARMPGWGEGAAGLALYLACLGLPLGFMATTGTLEPGTRVLSALWRTHGGPDDAAYDPEKILPRLEARLAESAAWPEAARVEEQLAIAEEMGGLDDFPAATARARALYQSLWAQTQARAPHDPQRAQALLGLADTAATPAEATPWRLRLVADLQGVQGPARLLLAQAQEGLATQPPPGQTRAQQLALLLQAVENRRAASPLDDYLLLHTRAQLASLLDAHGHAGAAQAQLQANVAALQATPRPQDRRLMAWAAYRLMEAETLLAWFLIEHGQADAALALARASAGRAPAVEHGWAVEEALRAWLWAGIAMGDSAAVRQAVAQQHAFFTPPQGQDATYRPTRPVHLDHLVAAELLQDGALRQQALAALQCAPQQRCNPCQVRPRSGLGNDWRGLARARRSAAAQAAGLCPPV